MCRGPGFAGDHEPEQVVSLPQFDRIAEVERLPVLEHGAKAPPEAAAPDLLDRSPVRRVVDVAQAVDLGRAQLPGRFRGSVVRRRQVEPRRGAPARGRRAVDGKESLTEPQRERLSLLLNPGRGRRGAA